MVMKYPVISMDENTDLKEAVSLLIRVMDLASSIGDWEKALRVTEDIHTFLDRLEIERIGGLN